jgi:hypothetical protein
VGSAQKARALYQAAQKNDSSWSYILRGEIRHLDKEIIADILFYAEKLYKGEVGRRWVNVFIWRIRRK